MLVWEHAGIVWSLLAPAMLGWDCIYSTGAIIAEGNQEGRADGVNANLWKMQHFPEVAGLTSYTN